MRSRRTVFLHRGAAFAVPFGGHGVLPPPPTTAGRSMAESEHDPVAAEALRQFKAGIRAQVEGKGEGARQAASALRILTALAKATALDDELRRMLRREIDTHGREEVLRRRVDPMRLAADARELGLARPFAPIDPDIAVGHRVLESFLAFGVTPHLLRAAEFFRAVGVELDGRHARRAPQAPGEAAVDAIREWASEAEAAMTVAWAAPDLLTRASFAGIYIGARVHEARRAVTQRRPP